LPDACAPAPAVASSDLVECEQAVAKTQAIAIATKRRRAELLKSIVRIIRSRAA